MMNCRHDKAAAVATLRQRQLFHDRLHGGQSKQRVWFFHSKQREAPIRDGLGIKVFHLFPDHSTRGFCTEELVIRGCLGGCLGPALQTPPFPIRCQSGLALPTFFGVALGMSRDY